VGVASETAWRQVRNWSGLPIPVATRRTGSDTRTARSEGRSRGAFQRSQHRTPAG